MESAEECAILIVDDDSGIRETVSDVLSFEGYPVHTATNGEEALETIGTLRAINPKCPCMLLLDMRMPVLDGWGVARELRERGIEVPIIVMTAARDARVWAREIGADGCLA